MKEHKSTDRLSKFFAHPFVIAIFASGVLTYFGYIINNHYTIHEKQTAYLREITDKKYKLLSESTTSIHKEIALLYHIKYYRAWLSNLNNKIDERGRTRIQVLKEYEKTWALYNNCHNCISSLSQIEAFFENKEVVNKASNLIKLIDDFEGVNYTEKEKKVMRQKVNIIYTELYKLSHEMGVEIRKELSEHTKYNVSLF